MAKRKGDNMWAWAVMNLGIVALVGFVFWLTHSLWAFLGLLFFLFSARPASIKTQCPKCNHKFVATEKEDDEDDDN